MIQMFNLKALPGHTITFNTSEDLKEGDLVIVSGDKEVSKAGAGVEAIGVIAVGAEAGLVTVLINKPLAEMSAGGSINAGDSLQVGESGVQSITIDGTTGEASGAKVGVALTPTTASGQKTLVALTL
jgi:hypothetical protein